MLASRSCLRLLALIVLFCVHCTATIHAQKPADLAPAVKFGKITTNDFASFSADSTAEAVVQYTVGSVSIDAQANDLWLEFIHHVRIQIRKKSAYDRATVQIPVRRGTNGQHEFVQNIDGYMYNLANGQVTTDKLTKTGYFTEKASSQFWIEKFTLPNVREGSIIECKYTVRTPFSINYNPRTWQFQQDIPVAWSEYRITIPNYFYYKMILGGYLGLAVNETKNQSIDLIPGHPGAGATAYRFTDFPSFQFNHVILCVPDGRDTTFLECTSGHNAAGYVGDFTGNRHVLLVLPDGGRLTKTPSYRPADNLQQRRITVTVTEQGDAVADVQTRYTGLQQDDYASAIHRLNRDDQRSWLLKRISIPAFELSTFTIREQPGRVPAVIEALNVAVRRWATASGTRLFLPLNLMSGLSPATPLTQPRKEPVDLDTNYDFEDSDTITYQLPKGYTPEYQLEPLTVESAFGRYAAKVTVEGERVTYIRRITMHRGRFPASAYAEWVSFRKKIAKADRAQMVFVKRT